MNKLELRAAKLTDIVEIVTLLQDDILGKSREHENMAIYKDGLNAIIEDKNNEFYVAILDHEIVGCFQLTMIPSLSRGAAKRAQIESVRVKSSLRGRGIGRQMMEWAIEQSRVNGCGLVQLTTDKSRATAHEFYLNMGFEPTHIGMKLKI